MYKKCLYGLFIFFGAIAPLSVRADSNNITALVFTTFVQTVAPNTLSTALTVGTVNVSGASEKVSETNDVTFTTTSQTGQFLNASGQAVSTTMSTNTASRTFFYQDSTSGTYTLTVTIKGRTSGKQFSASQQITISGSSNTSGNTSSGSSDNSNATSTDDSDATTTDTSSPNLDSGGSYAYSSQVTAYVGPDQEPFQISIGRDRITTVGTPVSFEAKLVSDTGDYSGMTYSWSFGDGTSWNGSSPTHTYLYPGDYIVVLNTSRYGNEAVSEAHVKVLSPQVSISADENTVTITNASDYELNVGGWSIVDGSFRFVLPKDTLVGAHSETHIPRTIMKDENMSDVVTLFNPSSDQVATTAADGSAAVAYADSDDNQASSSTIGADASDTMISLPDGMSMADFSTRFKQQYSLAMAQSDTGSDSQAAIAAPLGQSPADAQAAPTIAPVAVVTTKKSTMSTTSSNVASVIYSIPHSSGGGIFSGIGSWFGHLFGK